MQREGWLFVRGEESIRIIRPGTGTNLVVTGPGPAEHSKHFDSEDALEQFCDWYEKHLLSEGWTLHVAMDRRRPDQPSPPGPERRRRKRDKA